MTVASVDAFPEHPANVALRTDRDGSLSYQAKLSDGDTLMRVNPDLAVLGQWRSGNNLLPKIANAGLPALKEPNVQQLEAEALIRSESQSMLGSTFLPTLQRLPRGHSGMLPYRVESGPSSLFVKHCTDKKYQPSLHLECIRAAWIGECGHGPQTLLPPQVPPLLAENSLVTTTASGPQLTDDALKDEAVLRHVLPALRSFHNTQLDPQTCDRMCLRARPTPLEHVQMASTEVMAGGHMDLCTRATLIGWANWAEAVRSELTCGMPQPDGLVHGDCQQRNLHYDPLGKRLEVIDCATLGLGKATSEIALLAMDAEIPLGRMPLWAALYDPAATYPHFLTHLQIDLHLERIRRLMDLHTWGNLYDAGYHTKIDQYVAVVLDERNTLLNLSGQSRMLIFPTT